MIKRIKNCNLYTPTLGMVQNAQVIIEDNRIRYAGPLEENPELSLDEEIDGKGKLIMPGLINAHGHVAMTLLRSRADDLPLQQWLTQEIFPIEDKLTPEDVYWGAMLGIAEMLAGGTTTFTDMYFFEEQTADAAAQAGVRAMLGRAVMNDDGTRLREAVDFYDAYNGQANDRIRVAMMPHAEYTMTVDGLLDVAYEANRLGCPIHIHASETQKEHEECIQRHAKTPVELFDSIGLLTKRTSLAHGVWMTQSDIQRLYQAQASLVHCPGSNCKLGSGLYQRGYSKEELAVLALGTDGAASNNRLDLWREMYLMSMIAKGNRRDASILGAAQALDIVWRGGARALGLQGQIGELLPGYKADIILVDTQSLSFQPGGDIVANLVYCARAQDVVWTMVDGEIVYQEGDFKNFDLQEVLRNARRCSQRLYAD